MRIEYDPKRDFLNIEFIVDEAIAESIELDGVVIDYSKDGRIVAIEILDAGKRTTKGPLDLIDFSIIGKRWLRIITRKAGYGISKSLLRENGRNDG